MQLVYHQHVPAKPRDVWPFITQPELMNRWSTAQIGLVSPGEFGEPGTVGAVRSITIPAPLASVTFREVIVDAAPGRRLVYRVVDGLPIRHHRGEITLEPSGRGTDLRWKVEYAFPLEPMEWGAQLVLDPELRRSLARLADVIASEPGPRLVPRRLEFRGDRMPSATLWSRAERALREQQALADRLERQGDPKAWFTRVYSYVTEEQLKSCRTGRSQHPAWVLRLVEPFHHYYVGNLLRWMGEAPGPVEAHWRSAFRAMDEGARWHRNPVRAIAHGLAKGVQAHIEEDLPRALADVYVRFYAGRCDYARFRADYLLMADVFRTASMRLMAQLRAHFPFFLRWTEPFFPREVRDLCIRTVFYDFQRQRWKTFERGGRLAEMLLSTQEPRGERAMQATVPLPH